MSPSTVSRVVNNRPGGVSDDTRKRVRVLLKESDYYPPNETARSLVNQSTNFIGILIDDIRTIHHTQGGAYIIERELVKLGYCSFIFNTGADDGGRRQSILKY